MKWGAGLGVGLLGAKKAYRYLGKPLLAEAKAGWKGAKDFGKKWFVDDITTTTKGTQQEIPFKPREEIPFKTGDPDTMDALRQKVLKEYYDAGYTARELNFITENIDDYLVLQGPKNLRKITDEAYGVDNPLNKMNEAIDLGASMETKQMLDIMDIDDTEKIAAEVFTEEQLKMLKDAPYEMKEFTADFMRKHAKSIGMDDADIEMIITDIMSGVDPQTKSSLTSKTLREEETAISLLEKSGAKFRKMFDDIIDKYPNVKRSEELMNKSERGVLSINEFKELEKIRASGDVRKVQYEIERLKENLRNDPEGSFYLDMMESGLLKDVKKVKKKKFELPN